MTQQAIDLQIGGMSCASCAARIETKLNRMPGVLASVNYATERAHVVLPEGTEVAAAIATVEATGYTAVRPAPPRVVIEPGGVHADEVDAGTGVLLGSLRRRLLGSAVLTLPVLVLAMVTPWQFVGWQWLSLALAAPVVAWGAWPFHRAALVYARRGAATMDTLISIGVLAAVDTGPACRYG